MRILKKFFLAAGLIGAIGSVGFAREAEAATGKVQVTVEFDAEEGTADFYWENTDEEVFYDYITSAKVSLGGTEVYNGTWEADEMTEMSSWIDVDPSYGGYYYMEKEINKKASSFTKDTLTADDLKATVVAVIVDDEGNPKSETVTATVVADAYPEGAFKFLRVNPVVKPANAGKLFKNAAGESALEEVTGPFYTVAGKTWEFSQSPASGATFKEWSASPFPGTVQGTKYKVVVNTAATVTATYEGSGSKDVTSATITSSSTVTVAKGDSFNAKVSYEPSDASVTEIKWGYRKGSTGQFSPFSTTGSDVNLSTTGLSAGEYEVKAFVYYGDGKQSKSSGNSIALTVTTSPIPTTKIEKVSIKAGKGTSGLDTKTVTLNYGDTLHFAATYSPDNSATAEKIEWYLGDTKISEVKSGNKIHNVNVTSNTQVSLRARVYNSGDPNPVVSDPISVTLKPKSDPASYVATTFKIDSDQLEYVTQGYTIEVKGTITGTYRDNSYILFEKAKGDGVKVKEQKVWKKDDTTNNFSFRVDTSDCSVSSGETLKAVVKVTAKNGKEENGVIKDLVNEEFITIEVHPKSTLSYASDTRKFSYTAPKSVNTGTESGKDSDGDKDNQLTNFTGCKGVLIKVWKGDVSGDPLWTSTSAATGGNSATINAESLVTALNNDKKLSDSGDFKFRVYPCNGSNKYNKNVYSETTIHIYKATVNGTGITVTNYYALSGQEIEIKAIPIDPTKTWTADSYWMDDAAKKEGQTRKVKITEDKTFTAVLGTKTTSDNSASGRAGVNKWGQSNVGVYFAVVFVIGAVCLGLHLYDRKKKNL